MNELESLSWSEDQIDALTEIMNMGIGVAASSLSEMVGEEVILNIPKIRLVSRHDISQELSTQCPEGMSYVFQDFSGTVHGRSALLFPIQKSFNLVKALLGNIEIDDELTEMEQEALSEVGNVILNACIATLVNNLALEIEVEIPQYVRGGAVSVLLEGDTQLDHSQTNLFCAVNFSTRESGIEGYVMFLLELPSVKTLKNSLEEYLENIMSL
ncbi:MAG: chemotaxis protein CheX [Sneathiella sp.]|nr:chemotaxis protein CheX [Sneathiella sp.]